MKYLVVIGLIVLLLVLLLRRLRPYLRLVQEFINTLRRAQQMGADSSNPRNRQTQKLVCCETCGTWVPSGRALTTGSTNSVFCSKGCLSEGTRRKKRA